VRELHLWYQPHRILELATLLVVERPDSPGLTAAELKDRLQVSDVQMQHIEAPLIGVSSSDLRKRLAEGRSVRYIIPRAVEAYIEDKHLYRENQS
jgi:nicotinate-nucleotide adenylyltransferase